MSLSQEQAAFLLDVCKLIEHATQTGFMVTGGELARTPEQQAIYVKTGRSKTMDSIHLTGAPLTSIFSKMAQSFGTRPLSRRLAHFGKAYTRKTDGAAISKVWWIAHILSGIFDQQLLGQLKQKFLSDAVSFFKAFDTKPVQSRVATVMLGA